MSQSLFCPHCRAAIVPLLKPVGLKTATDFMADTRRQQLEASASCPVCGKEIRVVAVYNERGQFEQLASISGYQTLHSSCPVCHQIGLKQIDIGKPSLPPTGGDYEWLECFGVSSFCPICDQAFEATVKITLGTKKGEIKDFRSNHDSWAEQYILTKVFYARGEVYSQEAVRSFCTRDELDAFWNQFEGELRKMSVFPECFEWQRLPYLGGNYIWE